MNTALVNYYLPLERENISLDVISDKRENVNVFKLLNELSKWTYEITHEEYIEDGTAYFVNVVVYLPGFVQSGVGRSNTDFNRNHKIQALNSAMRNALSCGLAKPLAVNSDNQGNIEKEKEVTRADVSEANSTQTQTSSQVKTSYSKEQIERMTKFKKDYSITSDETLMSMINRWDPSIKEKKELTPNNIDTFLDWVDKLGGF